MNSAGFGNPGLHRLLCSNVAPNAYEATFLRGQIDNITSQVSQLRSRLDELEDQLCSYRALLSPLRRMPAEILGEIFVFFLPDVLQPGTMTKLVDLQLVCKSWRDAARLSHKLWSALSFPNAMNIQYGKVQQWFSRAGSIPKSLAFSSLGHDSCGVTLAALLASLEGTLDHLSLSYRGPGCFQKFVNSFPVIEEGSSTPPRPWDHLKSFTLKFDNEWDNSPDQMRSMFLQLPPNITSFELHLPSKWSQVAFGTSQDSASALLPLPTNLLERLSSFTLFCNWAGTQWLEATLGHCVNLETLTIDFMGTYWMYNRYRPDTRHLLDHGILLPKVRTLRLQNVCPPSIEILAVLRTPQLVELDIDFQPDDENTPFLLSTVIRSFVMQSECETSLRSLRLRFVDMKAADLNNTLHHLPFLTHLTLQDVFILKEEDYPLHQTSCLETLELLELQPDFNIESIANFLRSRRPYSMENGEPVFQKPQDTLKRLKVTYQDTQKHKQHLDRHEVVEVLRKWGGVSFDIGPILYLD